MVDSNLTWTAPRDPKSPTIATTSGQSMDIDIDFMNKDSATQLNHAPINLGNATSTTVRGSDIGSRTIIQPAQGTVMKKESTRQVNPPGRPVKSLGKQLSNTGLNVGFSPGGGVKGNKEKMLGQGMDMEWELNYISKAAETPGCHPSGCSKAHPGCLVSAVKHDHASIICTKRPVEDNISWDKCLGSAPSPKRKRTRTASTHLAAPRPILDVWFPKSSVTMPPSPRQLPGNHVQRGPWRTS